jgi:hypothetical protein
MKSTTPFTENLAVVARDIGNGFFEITHSSFALLGLAVMFATITVVAQPDIRQAGEVQLMTWLQDRQEIISGLVSGTPAERATAISLKELPKSQAALAQWLGRKYNRAPEAMGALVEEAFESGNRARIDPHLILAVMAVESGFNPFSQSPVGAQGLMQVMTHIHIDKFESFGGRRVLLKAVCGFMWARGTWMKTTATLKKSSLSRVGFKRYPQVHRRPSMR